MKHIVRMIIVILLASVSSANVIPYTYQPWTILGDDVYYSIGNVGIGTTAPDGILELNMGTDKEFRMSYNDADGSATDYAKMEIGSAGLLTLTTVDADAALGHIALMPDGNVGIGTASPAALLDVAGTISSEQIQLAQKAWSESYDSSEAYIYSLATYNGKLYAGSASGGKVFVYDGTTWGESYDSSETYIFSLAVYNGKLYAGSFPGGKVFVYDGTTWSESYDSSEAYIYSLAAYNGKLYAGSGDGGKVFVYDGTTWSESYDSSETYIRSLAAYNGKLYAGSYPEGKVFVYDGTTWSESYDSSETYTFSLATYNGKLYAGSYPEGKVFVYDGTTWSESYDSSETRIYSLAAYNGKLYAGSNPEGKVFVYDGTTWSESYDSSETYIFSLATYNGKLYAGSDDGGKVFVYGDTYDVVRDSTIGSLSIHNQANWWTDYQGIIDNNILTFGSDKDYSIGYNSSSDNLEFLNGATIGSDQRVVIDPDGNIGIGTAAPDGILELNMGTDKEFRMSYNDADGSATDYAKMEVGSAGSLTITTVDADASLADIILAPDGDMLFNTTTRPTANGGGVLVIGNVDVNSVALGADTSGFYSDNEGASSEMYVMDEADNATKISPHNGKGEWVFYSKNTRTGRVVEINMEALVKEVERLSGKKFLHENKPLNSNYIKDMN